MTPLIALHMYGKILTFSHKKGKKTTGKCDFASFPSVYCCLVVTCGERADLFALVCGVLLCFCHFPMWYPGSGVVLNCIDS